LDNLQAQIQAQVQAQQDAQTQILMRQQQQSEAARNQNIDKSLAVWTIRLAKEKADQRAAEQAQRIENSKNPRWVAQQQANLKSPNPVVRKQARENLSVLPLTCVFKRHKWVWKDTDLGWQWVKAD